MATEPVLSSQVFLKLDGTDVDKPIMANVAEITIDQHSHLPDMFSICLLDPGLAMLDKGPFDLTKKVEISAENADGEKSTLFKGEITALEPSFEEGMIAELTVRGFDASHRLYRETKSRAFLNKKDSDLASEIAQSAGLKADVETTNTVYDHIFQDNQTDLTFLMQRAWRIGYECFVDDGKLTFRKPPADAAKVTLTWGDDLLSFQPRMTLAEQVDEVTVRGWDVDSQKAIVGQAKKGELYPKIGESKNGASWAHTFSDGKLVIVDQPVVSQAEANALAAARLNERSGAFVQAKGHAFRRPDIKAGKMVKLEGLGDRLSGSYLVTNAVHVYSAEGWDTNFVVCGSRVGSLVEQINGQKSLPRWPGVVTAVVTNSDDPKDWGRVKVKFPWMTDDAESEWARVVGIGAGPEAGYFVMPDVDDEVLVAFEHGDFNRPFVLGGMWNGQHSLPAEAAAAAGGEKPLVRTWHSRSGHWLAMYDNADNKVEMVTAGGHAVTLSDADSKIEIKSAGGLIVTLDDSSSKISIKGSGDISVEAGSNLDLKASSSLSLEANSSIDIKASGQVTIKGQMVNIN